MFEDTYKAGHAAGHAAAWASQQETINKVRQEAEEELHQLKAEYEAHTDELQAIIDSNEYEMRTVWYKGKAWACSAEVHAHVRADTARVRALSNGG